MRLQELACNPVESERFCLSDGKLITFRGKERDLEERMHACQFPNGVFNFPARKIFHIIPKLMSEPLLSLNMATPKVHSLPFASPRNTLA